MIESKFKCPLCKSSLYTGPYRQTNQLIIWCGAPKETCPSQGPNEGAVGATEQKAYNMLLRKLQIDKEDNND